MSYLDEGPRDGEVVVMLHGNPSWSYYWRMLVAGLSDRYRCIVPDHVGMGLSDKPDDDKGATPRYDYTLQSRVDDLEALLRDTLVEALPLQPLCREGCRGLCSQCGVDLNEHPDHHHDVTDLRFAALAGLKAQLEAEGAKADIKKRVREGGEREVKQLRDRAQRDLDRLADAFGARRYDA